MACITAERSLAVAGERLRLSSGDDTEVPPAAVPEAKSKGACTASLGSEPDCEGKPVESPTGAAKTPADSALDVVPAVARSDAVATVAEAAGRWKVLAEDSKGNVANETQRNLAAVL
ncbi:hypothetical protein HPB52_019772 [Rhipicephalus sanguineus]|uniref:Uncharacterized protein n=1 Tax=Rhipicephalus sanguineus TaxID=34632 RepID=A0A9D4T7W9_RHISA|nr:hypothetical protein HPB52_019772 [Rhipicephalus sanguineus]